MRLIRHYDLDGFTVWHLDVEEVQTGQEREVTLLQFTTWPEQGVPETALPLLHVSPYLCFHPINSH